MIIKGNREAKKLNFLQDIAEMFQVDGAIVDFSVDNNE